MIHDTRVINMTTYGILRAVHRSALFAQWRLLPAVLGSVVMFATALAAPTTTSSTPPPVPAPPAVAAKAYIVLDFNSGQVLAESSADSRVEPASLTKIMTAYVVFSELEAKHTRLDALVTISENAWRTGGSRSFVEVGKQIPVQALIMGMIVQSGNDATVALAEHIAGSEEVFANVMNQRAQELGMQASHFTNSTGLPDPNHYTTARD
ncbi:MAG: D-alanyl-D-alanine carboxypeptidase (penicillin-binding protein 5/6), partial [Halothiobacillaceae bacterium]